MFPYLSTLSVGICILLLTLFTPTITHAEDPHATLNNDSCISCHEDLYYLHDTGNWFCLKESPMACVDCHGGNPTTTIKELAHTNRAAHPVINEDISKCQECHPDKCKERLQIFDEKAGISKILVAAPYTSVLTSQNADVVPAKAKNEQESNIRISAREFVPILLVAGAALAFYYLRRTRHSSK